MDQFTWVKLPFEVAFVILCLIVELLKELYFLVAKRKVKDIHGKTALVTGAAQGLGRELALQLAKKGCNVICVDILTKGNEETAKEVCKLGQKAIAYTCDITNREKVMKLADEVGRVDILFNNAGIVYFDPMLDTPPNILTKLIDVNITSHFWMIQAFLPGMLERKEGHIVATASCAGLEGLADAVPYSATKFAVVGFMRTLQMELHSKSQDFIKTSCICPYFINTMNEVKLGIESRLPKLETKDAAREIIKAVQLELPEVTIPGSFKPMIAFNSILPRQIQLMMRDVFYARVLSKETINTLIEKEKCQ